MLKTGRSVVLTSHSMDECEALCTRITIMVGGRLVCLGSVQRLRSRHGTGYTLVLKVRGNQEATRAFVAATFPTAVKEDEHEGYLHYIIPGLCKLPCKLGDFVGVCVCVRGGGQGE